MKLPPRSQGTVVQAATTADYGMRDQAKARRIRAKSVAIALFTRDLRVHDNPVLSAAAGADEIVPLFVLDSAIAGFAVPNRAHFLADSLADLDAGLGGARSAYSTWPCSPTTNGAAWARVRQPHGRPAWSAPL